MQQSKMKYALNLIKVGTECSKWLGLIIKLGAFVPQASEYLHTFIIQDVYLTFPRSEINYYSFRAFWMA